MGGGRGAGGRGVGGGVVEGWQGRLLLVMEMVGQVDTRGRGGYRKKDRAIALEVRWL